VQRPDDYALGILAGFASMSRFVCSSQRRTRFRKFIAQAARRSHLRSLERATAEYYRWLIESLEPRNMKQRGQRLEYLLSRCGRDRIGSIEARSLVRCSIPRFYKNLRAGHLMPQSIPPLHVMLTSADLLAARLQVARQFRSMTLRTGKGGTNLRAAL
jgi:Domain of unknown function (DUF4135)